jgi:hypothetical protein
VEPKCFFSNFNLLITMTNGNLILRVTAVTTRMDLKSDSQDARVGSPI